jgi:serine/threonine protein kinase/Tfp pilus assembly protein PilF
VKTEGKRICKVCGTTLNENSDFCPVCILRGVVSPETESLSAISSELRFEHYTVLKNEDGTPIELGRGAMGVTYKAFDVHLQCPVALKIINARYIGDASARHRFVREARAAASVRHPNVASVLHLGESGGNYFYAMEFVDGETLEELIRKSGRLDTNLAIEVVTQVAAGLTGIEKQHLVHRDVKPSNIMISWEQYRLESVKIIDLGLTKGVAERDTISVPGSFVGTPAYASPEQFSGLGTDIRSDLYSLGVTLWEMVSGSLPFQGSAAELMYQHQHASPPTGELRNVPASIVALLQVLLEKDPSQRFQGPAQLRLAVSKVREAMDSNSVLSAKELRRGDGLAQRSPKSKPRNHSFRWLVTVALGLVSLALGAFLFYTNRGSVSDPRGAEIVATEKSIAVLPFESLSPNKDDSYFADGVQDEILNNLAKIAQLKVISRTSVMQYRSEAKRDLRQIARALGVANVLEGTVRRNGNRVRVTTELIEARNDNTIWADSYDRDLTDIFAIQSEVAQTIAGKLSAALSPTEKKTIEAKPTDNLGAYDLYLRGKELLLSVELSSGLANVNVQESLMDAAGFFEKAVRLDPEFTLAYCASENAYDLIYFLYDPTPDWLAKADQAVNAALRLQPDLPEVHLANASHLYYGYQDYNGAQAQLALARRGLPNDARADFYEALIDRRQGKFEQAIAKLNEAITRDPRNPVYLYELANSLSIVRQFRTAEQAFDRAIELQPDQPMLKVEKAVASFWKNGDDSAAWSAIKALPTPVASATNALSLQLQLALADRDWDHAVQLIEKLNGSEDSGFAYGFRKVPVDCYSILMSRLRREPIATAAFDSVRERLNLEVLKSPQDAGLMSQLAVLDALLNNKATAISEGKRAAEMLPVSRDAIDGPRILANLALVYAWTDELNLAFITLSPLTKMPNGIYYGQLKREPYWEPLRKDPRFEKLLAELAPPD